MKKNTFTVSVVIPNWNGIALLEKNLPAVLKAAQNKMNSIVEVILVDDGSTDDSVRFLRKNFHNKIRLFKHTKNRGFSAACNMGARMAKGDLVCLLNSDVIPNSNFLVTVGSMFADSTIFAVGLHEKNYGPATGDFKGGIFTHKNAGVKKNQTVSLWASGGSAVFRKTTWKKLKGFDETLFTPFYWEDVDLSYRAWKRGYKVMWDPAALVEHKHESSINTNNFTKKYMDIIKERNELLFIWKNITSQILFKKHVRYLFSRTISHPGYLRVIAAAWKKRDIVKKLRAIEQKETTVSDEAVFSKFRI